MPRRLSQLLVALVAVGCLWVTAMASGADEPAAGYAAVVSGLPGEAGWLTVKQFDQRKGQVRAERRAGLGQGKTSVGEESLRQLLEEVDVEAEAERRGLHVSDRWVAREMRWVKRQDFKSIKQFDAYLKQLRMTELEARRRLKINLLQQRIEDQVTAGDSANRRITALHRYFGTYDRRWRSRTVCRAALATDRCSNGPPLPTASESAGSAAR